MQLPLLALGFVAVLILAYRLYGRWLARQLSIDDERATPATTLNDGVDYVPTPPFYLFAQHFSAIAAAGPIAGPIIACLAFGWLPCLLWIGLGVVLIGAVHDFTTLTASVRHGGHSIADIARGELGSGAGRAMMAFIWIALIFVIVAFSDITAGTFVAGTDELREAGVAFNPGGAVAAASVMYLALALVLGLVRRLLNPPLWLATLLFVPATFGVAWAGTHLSTAFVLDHRTWALLILAYCCVASVVPVWALLQPRGYLGGFVLFAALALGVIGVFFGGYEIRQPAFKGWDSPGAPGALYPFLFVTIACGACSGFHGLVCSGTTSKQVHRESHMKPVGYGAMLGEGFVALIALVTVMIASGDGLEKTAPGTIYGNGIGRFLTLLIGEENLPFAITFGAMAFSTFVFDTLDVCVRLGRYILQEFLGWRGRLGAVAATAIMMALPLYFILMTPPKSYLKFWTLFGASNQLLAALTLLTLTVWLYKARRRIAFALLPMLFVLIVTMTALVQMMLSEFRAVDFHAQGAFDIALVNAVAAAALIVLALALAVTAVVRMRSGMRASAGEPSG